ncbi:MAG: ABC transporter permease [Armatimonadetes bacterium]|nr:ABC transporter permease [Armatimonadota bacterium]
MLDRLGFLLTEAYTSLRRNRWMTFAGVTTATVALFLLGGLSFLWIQINQSAQQVGEKVQMRAFVKLEVPKSELEAVRRKVLRVPGVKDATLVPREQAWKEFREKFPNIVVGLDNPLPDAIRISLIDLKRAPEVGNQIQEIAEIEPKGVKYQDDQRELVTKSLRTLHIIGLVLGGMMLCTSGILIYNAIRMTIVARRREIRIMKLVGASRATVVAPMVIEGFLQGAIGGLFACILILACHYGIHRMIANLNAQAGTSTFPFWPWATILASAGAAYGVLCSVVAMRDSGRIRV